MKKVFGFIVLSLSLVACALDPGPDSDPTLDTTTSALTEQSSQVSGSEPANASVLACSSLWECEVCRNGTMRNVLYEVCDDGSQTLVFTGNCGAACL